MTEPRQPAEPGPLVESRGPIKTGRRRQGGGRGRWLLIFAAFLGLALVAVGLRMVPGSPLAPGGTGAAAQGGNGSAGETVEPTSSPTLAPLRFRAAPVTVTTIGFLSWALLDRRTGEIVGSDNMTSGTTTTASMIKAWLAADFLRRADESGQAPSQARLGTLEVMIRDSSNEAAVQIYTLNGKTPSIQRMITICGLTDSKATPGEWSRTYVSARDTVRLGDCIADGRAAGQKWTTWLLDMMRKVNGVGDFGPRKVLPPAEAATVAIKNGWLERDESKPYTWHVACLAIGDTWVLAVLQRYPRTNGWDSDFAHTREVAEAVARQLLNPAAS
jgi:hypothetical protein